MLFHNELLMGILLGIMVVVFLLTVSIWKIKETNKVLNQNIFMEFLWIILPMGILIMIGTPSIFMLYQLDETFNVSKSIIKIMGYQWYWTYEKENASPSKEFSMFGFSLNPSSSTSLMESYMNTGLTKESFDGVNNLSSTMELICQSLSSTRLIISAADVMHSWTLPSFFIKVDAIPGRLNQIEIMFPPMCGSAYGQCSELCGVNHSFMPIVVDFEL
uniref:Cytochrome c oxidase subunit 2 n=1 Tax=Baltalimania ylvae TaxID=3341436 RepID=A0A1X9WD85_9BILA|nr:cytochrome c oxidase subunit II [Archaphanostoma ylvae]ARS00893.1 cytochrome c oxidase subunit 2 [Archaphanostoma ylvae]